MAAALCQAVLMGERGFLGSTPGIARRSQPTQLWVTHKERGTRQNGASLLMPNIWL
jgi:hypothetical protein